MHALNVHYNSQKRKQKKTGKPRKDEIGERKQKNRERQIRNRIKEIAKNEVGERKNRRKKKRKTQRKNLIKYIEKRKGREMEGWRITGTNKRRRVQENKKNFKRG